MTGLDYFSLSFFLGGCTALGSAIVAWWYTTKTRYAWVAVSSAVAVWSLGSTALCMAPNEGVARVASYVLHTGLILIPVLFTLFITTLTQRTYRYRAYLRTLVVITLIFEVLQSTPLLVHGVSPTSLLAFAPTIGPLYPHFVLYFVASLVFACFILTRALHSADTQETLRLRFILASSIVGIIGFGSTLVYALNTAYTPWLVVLGTLFPIGITYGTVRNKLFTTRTIASEIFIIVLLFIFLIRLALAESFSEFSINVAVFAFSVVFGVLLVRNVHKEAEIRERGERLARYLANANTRLRELDKQKTEFVSLASHQLRGPIAAIVGYASLIQEGSYGNVPDNLKEPLSRVFESGKRISLMVDDFLNVTRIEQGRMSYNFQICDIKPLIVRAVEEIRVLAEKKKLSLSFVSDIEGPVLASIDETKFAQVLQNLIDNAYKFTVTGSITVRVSINERKTRALIAIADTGIGIAPEEVHNLSHKFNRASNANSVSVYGSGLGLYLSKEILKAHDGWIHIASAGIGRGSVFTVELPIEHELIKTHS